jgi:tetratricopeptide (TPR) repeat protein
MSIDAGIFNIKYTPHFMDDVLDYIKRNPIVLKDNPLIAIHYYELMINLNSDESNYLKLKSLKNRYAENLDIFGRYNIYINLSAFCVKMIRDGRIAYRKELLAIDIEILEKRIIALSDYISYTYLTTTVRNAARIREYKWAEKFIDAYQDRLDPKHKDFAVNCAKSEILLKQGSYEKALDCLSKITIEHGREKQEVRNMILKIYYETSSFENALSIIDSSRHFLSKEKQIKEERKKMLSHFLKFTTKLINLRMYPNETNLNQLKQKIMNTDFFANKDWLLEKIEELSSRKS